MLFTFCNEYPNLGSEKWLQEREVLVRTHQRKMGASPICLSRICHLNKLLRLSINGFERSCIFIERIVSVKGCRVAHLSIGGGPYFHLSLILGVRVLDFGSKEVLNYN